MEKDYIVAKIHPFLFKQEVTAYQNGNCVRSIKCNLDDIEKTILTFADIYKINSIHLVEKNHTYSLKIKEHLVSKYANKDFNITLW